MAKRTNNLIEIQEELSQNINNLKNEIVNPNTLPGSSAKFIKLINKLNEIINAITAKHTVKEIKKALGELNQLKIDASKSNLSSEEQRVLDDGIRHIQYITNDMITKPKSKFKTEPQTISQKSVKGIKNAAKKLSYSPILSNLKIPSIFNKDDEGNYLAKETKKEKKEGFFQEKSQSRIEASMGGGLADGILNSIERILGNIYDTILGFSIRWNKINTKEYARMNQDIAKEYLKHKKTENNGGKIFPSKRKEGRHEGAGSTYAIGAAIGEQARDLMVVADSIMSIVKFSKEIIHLSGDKLLKFAKKGGIFEKVLKKLGAESAEAKEEKNALKINSATIDIKSAVINVGSLENGSPFDDSATKIDSNATIKANSETVNVNDALKKLKENSEKKSSSSELDRLVKEMNVSDTVKEEKSPKEKVQGAIEKANNIANKMHSKLAEFIKKNKLDEKAKKLISIAGKSKLEPTNTKEEPKPIITDTIKEEPKPIITDTIKEEPKITPTSDTKKEDNLKTLSNGMRINPDILKEMNKGMAKKAAGIVKKGTGILENFIGKGNAEKIIGVLARGAGVGGGVIMNLFGKVPSSKLLGKILGNTKNPLWKILGIKEKLKPNTYQEPDNSAPDPKISRLGRGIQKIAQKYGKSNQNKNTPNIPTPKLPTGGTAAEAAEAAEAAGGTTSAVGEAGGAVATVSGGVLAAIAGIVAVGAAIYGGSELYKNSADKEMEDTVTGTSNGNEWRKFAKKQGITTEEERDKFFKKNGVNTGSTDGDIAAIKSKIESGEMGKELKDSWNTAQTVKPQKIEANMKATTTNTPPIGEMKKNLKNQITNNEAAPTPPPTQNNILNNTTNIIPPMDNRYFIGDLQLTYNVYNSGLKNNHAV